DVSFAGVSRQVLRVLVTDRYRSPAQVCKHHTQRCAGNAACPDYNGMLTFRLDVVTAKKFHHPIRCCRHEKGIFRYDASEILIGKTVDILIGTDHLSDLLN